MILSFKVEEKREDLIAQSLDTLSVVDRDAKDAADKVEALDYDPFDEDQAELRFLLSKPVCFLVVGKPGSGKTSLSKLIAQEWKCILINGNLSPSKRS